MPKPLNQCYNCGAMFSSDPSTHKCDPLFMIWCPDSGEDEEDADPYYGWDAVDAAKKWAKDHDDDMEIAHGNDKPTICVMDQEGVIMKFRVEGQIKVTYWVYPEK